MSSRVTFITGNAKKAEFLEKFLAYPVEHQKVNLDELQSLDLGEIVEHKAKLAYENVGSPVLVEDIAFSLDCLGGKLPGPFIKWFLEAMGLEAICRLCDQMGNRGAMSAVCYGYYDGQRLKLFEGSLRGTVPDHPRGADGFGWNGIFIPEGTDKTYAEMSDEETGKYSLRTTTVYPQLKEFLNALN